MRSFRILLLCGVVASMASCQTSRLALAVPSAGPLVIYPTTDAADPAATVMVLHDSQGPQGTRVMLSATEAAPFQQQ